MLRIGMLVLCTLGFLVEASALEPQAADASQAHINLPWSEFKQLYREQLRREWKQDNPAELSPLTTLDHASYRLQIDSNGARGSLTLSGRVLRGKPEPLDLFKADLAITRLLASQGGSLLSDSSGYQFYFDGQSEFQLSCEITLPVQEDLRSPYISLAIPTAVQNSVKLELAADLTVIEAPGQAIEPQHYFFTPRQNLVVRFDSTEVGSKAAPVIDSFSRFELLDSAYRVSSFFVPVREIEQPLQVLFPQSRWLSSSLKRNWIKLGEDGVLAIDLPAGWKQPFSLDYELDSAQATLQLPTIADNRGKEGAFQMLEPEAARITLLGDGLRRQLAPSRLSQTLRDFAALTKPFAQLPSANPLQVTIDRFDQVAAPPAVLDAVYLFSSYADNGSLLSVLRLEIPAQADQRLQIAAVADAEVWSLTVNGAARQLYGGSQRQWIIPLAAGHSVVELSYWQKIDKLGLQGRLALQVPALGLAARRLNLIVGLSERVELLALEGDLEPGDGRKWKLPTNFNGKPYFFSQPFYRGEAVEAAIHYREPANVPGGQKS